MESLESFVSFEIDGRLFAFSVKDVLEVLLDRPISPVPRSAEHVVGVINFRGSAITVVDTSVKFGLRKSSPEAKRIVVVVQFSWQGKKLELGCLCDAVRRVERVNVLEIQPVSNFGTYYPPALLKGVFYMDKELCSIIDVAKVFTIDEIDAAQQALAL